jgi:two-component system, response regulator
MTPCIRLEERPMSQSEVEIVLVEDDPADVELTLLELRRFHLANHVHVSEDGQDALDFIFCHGDYVGRPFQAPKLVLLDLKLPKVDGIEVLRAVRSDERTRLIPVVVMSSSKEREDVASAYKLHVNSYIQKPVAFGDFQKQIEEVGYYWMIVNEAPPDDVL